MNLHDSPARFLETCTVLFAFSLSMSVAAAREPKVVRFEADQKSMIRNPACGWVLYAADLMLPHAGTYWQEVAEFVPKTSIVYIRLPWSLYEPEEGNYAWERSGNLKALIDGAKERGLKLAFRIVLNSKDCKVSAAPAYVREAGAAGYEEKGVGNIPLWTPDPTDLVFRMKFEKFLEAFASTFDDPDVVDFIDAVGLGWWGEMHHVGIPSEKRADVYEWICSSYARHFKKVLLGTQVTSELGEGDEGPLDREIAIDRHGYVARLDSLGSHWMKRKILPAIIGDTPFFGESCYFSLESWEMWKNPAETYTNHRQVLEATLKDALDFHANTLDLRKPNDCRTWFRSAPDLVQRFIEQGGYRFVPEEISYPESAGKQAVTIKHRWRNLGVGALPNGNRRWNRKYRVAFALMSEEETKPAAIHIDRRLDPGNWRGTGGHDCSSDVSFDVPPGDYRLAVAIVDTMKEPQPAIRLAVGSQGALLPWTEIGGFTVRN